MTKKLLFLLLSLVVVPSFLAVAQTGKVTGRVIDRETKEPLIGANVRIEGTERGAATNVDGEYVILNVPIGKITIVASSIGYQKMSVRDILVRSGETTTRDFQMVSEAVSLGEVIITAEKPLVDKNVTNAKTTITQEDIENMPVRGVEGFVALQAGVVSTGDGLVVRGSRADKTGYQVDGITANDPMFGGRSVTVINNAIAEVNFQAGGYSAEFGGANAGMISTTTRSGGRKMRYEFEAYTDNWAKVGEKTLGTYSTGSSTYILTAGGPIAGPFRFFVAGQNSFSRTPASGWWQPYDLTSKYDALLRNTEAHLLLAPEEQDKIGIFDPQLGSAAQKVDYRFPGGMLLNAASQSWTLQGNVTAELNRYDIPVNIRVGGSYATSNGRGGAGIATQFAENRASLTETEDYSANMKLTHLLSPSTFYEIYVGFAGNYGVRMDPDHKHNLFDYGDSLANARFGYQYRADGIPMLTTPLFGASFVPYGYPLSSAYTKSRYNSLQAKLNFVHQIGRTHEIKTGGEFLQYQIRSFGIDAFGLKQFVRESPDAKPLEIAGSTGTNYFGYDMYGREDNTTENGPKEPVFAAFYALDKIELEDLVLNIGLRYDYINTNSKEFINPANIKFTSDGLIDYTAANVRDVPASATVSPRIGFSFPVSDQTVFYAQYGKFVQQSRLRNIYLGLATISSQIKGGYAVSSPVGFGLRPERTTQYDFGFRQQIGDNLAFDIGAFYKDIRDEIQQRQIQAEPGAEHPAYYAWVNGDFATSRGVSLKIDVRRVERVQVSADYSFSDARGTGSSPSSAFRALWLSPTETPNLPKYAQLLDFDQTHRGSVNIDYRFADDDGPELFGSKFLSRFGMNLLFNFNSGRPYTRVNEFSFGDRRTPVEAINSSRTPWTFQMDGRFDKTFNVGGVDLNVYLWVINILNIKNITSVYATSGSAVDNGFLATDEGQNRLAQYANYGQVFADLYQDFYYQQNLMNAGVYGAPRRIYLGVRASF